MRADTYKKRRPKLDRIKIGLAMEVPRQEGKKWLNTSWGFLV
jgi:hypothetical protein